MFVSVDRLRWEPRSDTHQTVGRTSRENLGGREHLFKDRLEERWECDLSASGIVQIVGNDRILGKGVGQDTGGLRHIDGIESRNG
jgi:hypothetical protein